MVSRIFRAIGIFYGIMWVAIRIAERVSGRWLSYSQARKELASAFLDTVKNPTVELLPGTGERPVGTDPRSLLTLAVIRHDIRNAKT